MRKALPLALAALACARTPAHPVATSAVPDRPAPASGAAGAPLAYPGERHLRNVRQLTFGGDNAEAYFSFDGRWLVFQSTRDGHGCDQEYVMRTDGSEVRQVSRDAGRTTCGYFLPGDRRLLYAATEGPQCPPRPDMSQGYVWPLYHYQIVVANADGSDPRPLSPAPGYNAEATVSDDGWIVFTSTRDGDLDLYKMRLDGSGLTRLTDALGYDGGAFFSRDGKRIVWRASRPSTPQEEGAYRELLEAGMVRPTIPLEIWTMDADGGNKRQVTKLGVASFAPYFLPDGKRIIFSSNLKDPKGRNFDLYLVNDDGTGLEQVTTFEGFDGFPMFSPDGKQLVFASNRNGSRPHETNVFIADWVE